MDSLPHQEGGSGRQGSPLSLPRRVLSGCREGTSLGALLSGTGRQDISPSTFTEKVMLEPFFTFLEVNFSRNRGGTSCWCTSGEAWGGQW